MAYNKVPVAVSDRSRQDLSSTSYGTTDFGRINIEYFTELVDGDTVDLDMHSFRRCAPLARTPNVKIRERLACFFVPHRLHTLRPEQATISQFSWQNWITGLSNLEHPYVDGQDIQKLIYNTTVVDASVKYRADYLPDARRFLSQMKLPSVIFNQPVSAPDVVLSGNVMRINPFVARSYQEIWWSWFRDSSRIVDVNHSDYVPLLGVGKVAEADVLKLFQPRYACFNKDYFTTAFQNPQSGKTGAGYATLSTTFGQSSSFLQTYDPDNVTLANGNVTHPTFTNGAKVPIQWERAAHGLQRFLERNNIAGSRYIERLLARFGNTPTDAVLQIPEKLGWCESELQIGDVTSNIDNTNSDFSDAFGSMTGSIAGQLAGKGGLRQNSKHIKFHAKESGTLMVVSVLIPSVGYYQGLPRELVRGVTNDRFDYFTPEMEKSLGFRAVMKSELYADSLADESSLNEVFGWQPAYSDYKHKTDTVHGDLVLDATSTGMSAYHQLRIFDGKPSNTSDFSMITPEARYALDRIFAIQGDPSIPCQLDHFEGYVHVTCKIDRPMTDEVLPELSADGSTHKINIPYGGIRL